MLFGKHSRTQCGWRRWNRSARNTINGVAMLNQDFREFIELLNANRVRYLVVGGYAVALHGHPRYTKDIDIWLDRDEENLENLKASKRAAGRFQDLADLENLA